MRTTTFVSILAFALLAAAAAPAAATPMTDLRVDVGVEAQAGASATGPAIDLPALEDAPLDVLPLGALDVEARAEAEARLEPTARAPDGGSAAASGEGEVLAQAILDAVEPVADAAPPVMAAAGFLAVLQALGAWRFLGLGAFAMYSRLSKSELLDNEHRDRVFQLIRDTPGIGVSEIAQRTGLGWGTTVYHLDRLERAKMVASERSGLHRCYFPVGQVAREERKAIGALKGDTTRTIAEFIVSRPGATQSELCAALGMSASAASKQISKLESAGLLRREREWKTVRLHPGEALSHVVAGEPAPALVAPGAGAAPALSA